jgi:hypothetical protein
MINQRKELNIYLIMLTRQIWNQTSLPSISELHYEDHLLNSMVVKNSIKVMMLTRIQVLTLDDM